MAIANNLLKALEQNVQEGPAHPRTSMKPVGVAILLAALVGFGLFFYFAVKTDQSVVTDVDAAGRTACPDHWHNGFDVYTQDASGPRRVDFVAPRWPGTSLHYYEWNNGDHFRAPGMSIASHAHMSGAEGSGSTNQLHYEKPGTCVGLADALRALDVHIRSDGMTLTGGLRQGQPDLVLTNNATASLHIWTQDLEGTWTAHSYSDIHSTQVKDGESFLIAFGNFTPAQVKQMQDGVAHAVSHDFRLQKLQKTGSATGTSTHA